MGKYFFDTSALVKRYQPEQGTDVVDDLFADDTSSFLISRLAIVETISALALKVRSGDLPLANYTVARKSFLGDVSQRKLNVVRMLVRHYRTAERLIDRHGLSRRFRTLDALQLSVALDLHSRGLAEAFVCADVVLCALAEVEGLAALNPLVGR
jgi:predicted nucleic acid-binding protein